MAEQYASKKEYERWRSRVRIDNDLNYEDTPPQQDYYNSNGIVTEYTITDATTNPFHVPTDGSNITKRKSRVTTFRERMQGADGGLMRLNDMQRRQVAERIVRREMHSIFDWLESTYLFKLLYHYAKRWRTGEDRQYGSYSRPLNRSNYSEGFRTTNPYYYRSYNPNATYSSHESLIRSIVDRWISFRDRISSTSEVDHDRADERMATDMADRLERYLFQQRRRRQRISYDEQESPRVSRLWMLWQAILQFFTSIFK
jgi:hypothetical protein